MTCNACEGLVDPLRYNQPRFCDNCFQFREEERLTNLEIQDEIDGLRTTNGSKTTPAVLYRDYYN